MYKKSYDNIFDLNLLDVLNEIRNYIDNSNKFDCDILLKANFIIEELVTNSFTYLEMKDKIGINFHFDLESCMIEYREVNVLNLDFDCILEKGTHLTKNQSLDQVGGLGLTLVKQLSKSFEYKYIDTSKTRVFTIYFQSQQFD